MRGLHRQAQKTGRKHSFGLRPWRRTRSIVEKRIEPGDGGRGLDARMEPVAFRAMISSILAKMYNELRRARWKRNLGRLATNG